MKFLQRLLSLLFPPLCIGCEKENTWLCEECFSLITLRENPECVSYGLDRLFVAAPYDTNPLLKKAIYHLKYKNHPEEIAKHLGGLLARIFQPFVPYNRNITVIPIPLHPNREQERGFNQASLLAQWLPFNKNQTLLIRKKETPPQVDMKSRKQRLLNLHHAFSVHGKPDPQMIYLLIDDLITTGATLENAAKSLKSAGSKEVWGLVVARNG